MPATSSPQTASVRRQAWREMRERVLTVTDARGRGMDPQIVELVTALNLLGFPTIGSCQGHLERALASPWVDFEGAEQEPAIATRYWAAVAELEQLHQQGRLDEPEAHDRLALCAELEPALLEPASAAACRRDWRRLRRLVADYQRDETPTPGYRLRLTVAPALNARLEVTGGRQATALPLAERREHLRQARRVMLSFGRYLRERYLHGQS